MADSADSTCRPGGFSPVNRVFGRLGKLAVCVCVYPIVNNELLHDKIYYIMKAPTVRVKVRQGSRGFSRGRHTHISKKTNKQMAEEGNMIFWPCSHYEQLHWSSHSQWPHRIRSLPSLIPFCLIWACLPASKCLSRHQVWWRWPAIVEFEPSNNIIQSSSAISLVWLGLTQPKIAHTHAHTRQPDGLGTGFGRN